MAIELLCGRFVVGPFRWCMCTEEQSGPALPISQLTEMQASPEGLCGCLRRSGFPEVVKTLDQVVSNMAGMPPGSELDINNVTLRLALDITGDQQLPRTILLQIEQLIR